MFARFFIDRPIFAAVLSIIITLAGGIAVLTLPVTQYPEITPPTVEVSANYPGANAQVLTDTVASPIEQQVNGVEEMMYMSSQCTNDGRYTLTVTFRPGTDLNLAQVLVQNRVNLAQALLPELVRRRGVTVKKKSPTVLMIINLVSTDGSRDSLYLSNYATIQLRDELSRLPGVGDISFLGQRDYSMRVWLDPQQLAGRNLSSTDVIRAIEQQNVQVAAGQIGQPPAPPNQVFQYTLTTLGRLSDAKQFGDIVLKTDGDGRITRLHDVARVELGALDYDQICTLNQRPSVALSMYQLPGSNALEIARQVRAKMKELQSRFPSGVDYAIAYDTTPFVDESIREVFVTLRDAIILVAVVVLIFLQGWRAAVIPLIAVPVAIIGTFAAMAVCGFSLNTLTLFGLVLAIGIVVDDAIVVVEAIEHHIETGKSPRDAAIAAMDEVSGPVIAVGLVLTAVFIPCLFITGIVGQFFQQFAVTIAISTVISTFNSLTLSPALAVLLLRPRGEKIAEPLPRLGLIIAGGWATSALLPGSLDPWFGTPELESIPGHTSLFLRMAWGVAGALALWPLSRPLNRLFGEGFALFNRVFQLVTNGYIRAVGRLLQFSMVVAVLYCGLLYVTWQQFDSAPTGFIPAQDKGYLLVNVQLPDSAALERTMRVMQQIEEIAGKSPGVRHTMAISGQSLIINAKAPNFGTLYVILDDFDHRSPRGLSSAVIARTLQTSLDQSISNAIVNIFGAPVIDGLGTSGGFRLVIEDRGDLGLAALQTVNDRIVQQGAEIGGLTDLFSSFRGNTPWLSLDIDRDAVKLRHVSLAEVFSTLQVNFGSFYVNDINRFGRTWQVNVQADAKYRMTNDDLKRVYLRSDVGSMVPLASVVTVREATGPTILNRYNLYSSAIVSANPAVGTSSGQALERLARVAQECISPSMRTEWTELALLQQNVSQTAMFAFLLAVILVFLVLAAQYESWALPLAVILVVPMCLLCSVAGVLTAGFDITIFTQIGFVVLVGLACKNSILIVEFARAGHDRGLSCRQATLDACKLRLRPIVMTSLAFVIGVVPLMIGQGAGAEMHNTLGTAVFYGMLGVTLFGVFLTPVFFFLIQRVADWTRRRGEDRQ